MGDDLGRHRLAGPGRPRKQHACALALAQPAIESPAFQDQRPRLHVAADLVELRLRVHGQHDVVEPVARNDPLRQIGDAMARLLARRREQRLAQIVAGAVAAVDGVRALGDHDGPPDLRRRQPEALGERVGGRRVGRKTRCREAARPMRMTRRRRQFAAFERDDAGFVALEQPPWTHAAQQRHPRRCGELAKKRVAQRRMTLIEQRVDARQMQHEVAQPRFAKDQRQRTLGLRVRVRQRADVDFQRVGIVAARDAARDRAGLQALAAQISMRERLAARNAIDQPLESRAQGGLQRHVVQFDLGRRNFAQRPQTRVLTVDVEQQTRDLRIDRQHARQR